MVSSGQAVARRKVVSVRAAASWGAPSASQRERWASLPGKPAEAGWFCPTDPEAGNADRAGFSRLALGQTRRSRRGAAASCRRPNLPPHPAITRFAAWLLFRLDDREKL